MNGSDLIAERARHRVTQQEVADRMGICRQTVSEIENDRIRLADVSVYMNALLSIVQARGSATNDSQERQSNAGTVATN